MQFVDFILILESTMNQVCMCVHTYGLYGYLKVCVCVCVQYSYMPDMRPHHRDFWLPICAVCACSSFHGNCMMLLEYVTSLNQDLNMNKKFDITWGHKKLKYIDG